MNVRENYSICERDWLPVWEALIKNKAAVQSQWRAGYLYNRKEQEEGLRILPHGDCDMNKWRCSWGADPPYY